MKMTKKTYRRIRKTLIVARGVFLALFGVLVVLCAISAGSNKVILPLIMSAIAVACFGISFFCDYLLGGYKSPFYY